jgi:hypothetical protein
MCCFLAALVFMGPRVGFLIFWLVPAGRVKVNAALEGWLIPLLGLVIVPWTVLAYVIFFPLSGLDVVWVGIAFAVDIAGYFGGFQTRKQVPGYTGP